jgi:hypothetical protein
MAAKWIETLTATDLAAVCVISKPSPLMSLRTGLSTAAPMMAPGRGSGSLVVLVRSLPALPGW